MTKSMTQGERMVWAAAFASNLQRWTLPSGKDAARAASRATEVVRALRMASRSRSATIETKAGIRDMLRGG